MIKRLRITALVANTVEPGKPLLGQHGLSLYVEADDLTLLWDTGASGNVLMHNFKKMGLDPSDVDAVALSHGHYDHTGGLKRFLQQRGPLDVFAHPAALEKKYAGDPPNCRKIGIPFDRDELLRTGNFILRKEPTEIAGGVWTTGEILRVEEDEGNNPRMKLKRKGRYVTDEMLDDQALVIETAEGVVVLFGCAHAGVINTLSSIRDRIGRDRIIAVFGGLHLMGAEDDYLVRVADCLQTLEVKLMAIGHCTGFEATLFLSGSVPSEVFQLSAGQSYEI